MSATDSTSTYSAKRRILYGVTTGGLLLGGIGMAATAQADAGASGTAAGSPGVASGNLINIPIDLPINLCGNTVNVVGLLDPAAHNDCANDSGSGGGATASGDASHSPGVGSGNLINIPVNAPVNVCGNSVSVVGIGNSAHGNDCANEGGSGGSSAGGGTSHSPGVGSGNLINVPVNVPVNVCGNSVSVVGIGNAVHGDDCANGGSDTGTPTPGGGGDCGCPPPATDAPPAPPAVTSPPSGTVPPPTAISPTGTLASTGSGAMAAAPLGLGLLGAGGFLTRRGILKSAMSVMK